MKRTTEFVLGLIGGIFGVFVAFFEMFFGGLGQAFQASGAGTISSLGIWALLLSLFGIVGSVVVKFKPKLGGLFMIMASVGGFICASLFFVLPGILLIIAGLMGVFRKSKPQNETISA